MSLSSHTVPVPKSETLAAMKKGDRSLRGQLVLITLVPIFIICVLCGLLLGQSEVSLLRLISNYFSADNIKQVQESNDYLVLIDIRLPRVLLGILVGSALAVCGVLMQGLFRNPLADPGIVGVSAGAGFGAVVFIVLGHLLPVSLTPIIGSFGIVLSAFLSSLVITLLLYSIATHNGKTSIATMLLAGIAISSFLSAIIGILVTKANDLQLRDIQFWSLGSLVGTTMDKVLISAPFIIIGLCIAPFLANGLNALALGEPVAGHLGFPVQRLKNISITLVALMCGAAVAVSGGIGFVGIVIPHILRLIIGPNHRYLIPCSALLGACLVILADYLARTVNYPAELAIGIITALIGAPFFLWILLRQRGMML
ncbi:iron ABC transporter permease [Bartonella sp. HY329]|uniref:FecCD family ABC transporter permease n=1 Tax=unclassified Bartonella TaxID=2645622 RepID=UPI0021C7FB5A|nr:MULTISPECIES: iron ABC transporter permease [unclassified Bartonella]UXM94219.1 iron ABC transporter permease [Bartonella sp. HY329]UXN08541.1 iron ABC transporter permease [Bartonella sp. HY328]